MLYSYEGEKIPVDKILAFDPGGTTGYCVYEYSDERYLSYGEIPVGNHHSIIASLLGAHQPDLVITERFDYRPKLGKVELQAIEYIGVLQLWAQTSKVPLVRQQQLKGSAGLWTDDKLKVLGLYQPGSPHAMDSIRQLLYFVTTELGDLYWVQEYRRLTET